MELGNNIKELRKQRGLRQEQLAEAMGVSTASVSKWETNQTFPELTLLAELADFFEVSMDTLVGHRLHAERMETMIAQMKQAADERSEETAAALCEKLLRNYPNSDRVADACADVLYQLFIYTGKKLYMERCIEETKRLMTLKQGEPEWQRLERIHDLGNQHELLGQWDMAKDYYEQSNVSGSSDIAIAGCLLKQEKPREAVCKLSDALVETVFQLYHAMNKLADGWSALREDDKACAALEWICGVMESLRYNTTTLLLTQIKLAGLYHECGKPELMEAALRKAAALAEADDSQQVDAGAEFLLIEKARKLLVSTGNREILLHMADAVGSPFAEIIHDALQ